MRMNKVIVVAGTRGTGKTDFAKETAFKMLAVFPKVIIIDTFESPVWETLQTHNNPERININVPVIPINEVKRLKRGIVRLVSSDTKKLMEVVAKNIKNSFIIFEDARKYIGDRLTDDSRNFILDSKQKNLDLLFNFHALRRIPIELLDVADILILKKTNEADLPPKMNAWPEVKELLANVRSDPDRFTYKALLLN